VILTIIVLALLVAAALWTVLTKTLIRSAIGLALTSVILTVLMFMLGANLAAVFELSVCAGLITVVFISTISMTSPSTKEDLLEKTRDRLRRYWYLPVIMAAAGIALAFFLSGSPPDIPARAADGADVKDVLWKARQTDILGQLIVLLTGVFGVIVLFKERKK
jgi:NADH-quinone oxidoreductase subunit J